MSSKHRKGIFTQYSIGLRKKADKGDEAKCPSCGKPVLHALRYGDLNEHFRICRFCYRVLQDIVDLTLEKRLNISIKKWRFNDIEGKEHEVVALWWGGQILHFGENGLYTDIFKDITP